jgi:spermidine synthase
MKLIIAAAVVACAAVCGFLFQDQTYRLRAVGQPSDQVTLDHRDSPYSSITWVASPNDDFLQLRFFDRVEGGICLHPSWDELIELAKTAPTLSHLVPQAGAATKLPPGRDWPFSWVPNPGCLSNSAYIRLFPISVLLNQHLMTAAKGEFRATTPRIMVVGLGSGIGLATLAYHFPLAAITVVDIDQVVVDMVRDHFPLLRWLGEQKLADGTPRLRFMVRDARQFIRYDAAREAAAGKPYDVVVLDAYTAGSTIPPHLMTREFFEQIAAILDPNGLVMANVIGSYTQEPGSRSNKHLVVGGAIRTFRAAGLSEVWNFPVMTMEDPGRFDPTRQRNNIIIASRQKVDPVANHAGWERLRAFVPYPELSGGHYLSSSYLLIDTRDRRYISASAAGPLIDLADPGLRTRMTADAGSPDGPQWPKLWDTSDRAEIAKTYGLLSEAVAKGVIKRMPRGWEDYEQATALRRNETDWVLSAQETYRIAVITAKDPMHSGEKLVGELEGPARETMAAPFIPDAPLFTDQRPNADIFNN